MKRKLMISFAVLLLLIGAMFAVYPAVANYADEKYQSTVRTEYEDEVQEIDNSALEAMRAAAEQYNESLSPVQLQFAKEGLEAASVDYHDLLDPSGSGIMGYVEIPKISVDLPIYHGTSEDVLQAGVGHMIGSSLPIGGEGCHSVLTGHSGVAEKKLFSDLDQLAVGDKFYLKVLDETLAYEVSEINTVLPQETELLSLVQGEDICTLVTCTPFGVNTHRLLVRGRRVAYEPDAPAQPAAEQEPSPSKSTWKDQYIHGLELGGGIVGSSILLFIVLLVRRKKGGRA